MKKELFNENLQDYNHISMWKIPAKIIHIFPLSFLDFYVYINVYFHTTCVQTSTEPFGRDSCGNN